jgi:hypothetical protein
MCTARERYGYVCEGFLWSFQNLVALLQREVAVDLCNVRGLSVEEIGRLDGLVLFYTNGGMDRVEWRYGIQERLQGARAAHGGTHAPHVLAVPGLAPGARKITVLVRRCEAADSIIEKLLCPIALPCTLVYMYVRQQQVRLEDASNREGLEEFRRFFENKA